MRSLDILIPFYNEAHALPELCQHLEQSFTPQTLESAGLTSVHFLFIDDGSKDGTSAIIAEKIRTGWGATLLYLSRNFGHQAALSAGLDRSTADVVAIIDADLQDPPELLLEMIQRLNDGFDVVYGQRRARREPFYKKMLYATFYRLCNFLSEVQIPLDAGDFCVMRREVVLAMQQLPEKSRFHRGLRTWVGFRQSAYPYNRPARGFGESKYSWSRLYKLATDGIASLSIRPLRITQVFLFVSSLLTLSFVGVSAHVYLKAPHPNSDMLWFLMTQSLVALASSMQLFSLYVMSAYLGRMYMDVKSRPSYIVMRTLTPPSAKLS